MAPKKKGEFFPSPDKQEQPQHVVSTTSGPAPNVATRRRTSSAEAEYRIGSGTAPRHVPCATFGNTPRFPAGRTPSPGPLAYHLEKYYEIASRRPTGGKFERAERFNFFPSPAKNANTTRSRSPSSSAAAVVTPRTASADRRSTTPTPNNRATERSQGAAVSSTHHHQAANITTSTSSPHSSTPTTARTNRAAELRRKLSSPQPQPRKSTPQRKQVTLQPRQQQSHQQPQQQPQSAPAAHVQVVDFNLQDSDSGLPTWSGLLGAKIKQQQQQQQSQQHRPQRKDEENGQQREERDEPKRARSNHYSKAPAVRDFSQASPFLRKNSHQQQQQQHKWQNKIVSPRQQQQQQAPLVTPRNNTSTTPSNSALGSSLRSRTPQSATAKKSNSIGAAPSPVVASSSSSTAASPSCAKSEQQRKTTLRNTSPAKAARSEYQHHRKEIQQMHPTLAKERRFSATKDFDFHELDAFFSNWLADAKRRGAI